MIHETYKIFMRTTYATFFDPLYILIHKLVAYAHRLPAQNEHKKRLSYNKLVSSLNISNNEYIFV